jgi:hypothetical protein
MKWLGEAYYADRFIIGKIVSWWGWQVQRPENSFTPRVRIMFVDLEYGASSIIRYGEETPLFAGPSMFVK